MSKLWTASDSFPPLTLLQNQDYITEQISFNFPHQLPLKSPKKIWWGALQTVSDLSAHIRIQRKIKPNIHQQSKNNQPHRVVGISLWLNSELKLCMFLRKGYLRDAGRAVLALQLMLMKIQRKRAALQPARVTTTILHFLALCTPNASRRRYAFLHFGPLRSLSFSSSEEVSRR